MARTARPRRSPGRGAAIAVAAALVLSAPLAAFAWSQLDQPPAHRPDTVAATPTPTPTAPPPRITFDPAQGAPQAPRLLSVRFASSEPLEAVSLSVLPGGSGTCEARLERADDGVISCATPLAPATDHVLSLTVTTRAGRTETIPYQVRTMGERLGGVPWYTEFEDPRGDPLACAAASVRIVSHFTSGQDRMTATQILAEGRPLNRSRDPGIDPVAIASMLERLDPASSYHYYRFTDRAVATKALAYWLARSGKPAIAITLNGQHAPVVIGFAGAIGATLADTTVEGLVVLDPQRGDLNPLTAGRRADKYRTAEFQTGRLLLMDEWYGDEWWFRYGYAASIRTPQGWVNIERNDGMYPTPHWADTFVILVDDGDAEWPAEREGRVRLP